MKTLFTILFALLFCNARAQESFLKAGANINLSFLTHKANTGTYADKVYYPPFPGINFSYERTFGNHFSWLMNIDLSRQPVYFNEINFAGVLDDEPMVYTDIKLTPEIRWYPFNKSGLINLQGQGLFLQLGLTALSYEFYSHGPYTNNSLLSPFSGKYYPAVPFGLGMKYPISDKTGMELNIQTNLNSMENWWPLQVGIKFYWLKGKPKTEVDKDYVKPDESALHSEAWWKTGAAFNNTFLLGESNIPWRELYYPPFASLNFSYERSFSNRAAWVLNLEPSHKSLQIKYTNNANPDREISSTQISFIPELRFYLRNKNLKSSLNQGLFAQLGFELFHFQWWTDGSENGSEFSFTPHGQGYFTRNVPVGFGYKFPVNKYEGIELNLNTNLSELINQGNNQTFSFGVKYFWQTRATRK